MARPEEYDEAAARGAERRARGPVAVSAHYDRRTGRVVVTLDNGLDIGFAPDSAEGLQGAGPAALSEIEISPSGFGLHFPRLDADLYLPGLLAGLFGSRKWMAAQLGAAGGRQRSQEKAASSRANGKLGGRPKKRVTG